MPILKPIRGHGSTGGIRRYLEKGGRALARDRFNLSYDERDAGALGEDAKEACAWDAEMDATRAAVGTDAPWRGKPARTCKHFVLSPDPGDDIDLGFGGLETLSPAALAPLFARTPALHKGDCGRAVIFCGSRGMVGAAAFCANACIRAGAGLTTLLCRESLLPMLQVLAPGATCVPLPETNGLLTPQAARITRETLDKADAACIGCGCGLTPDVTMLLRVFAEADCPIVWDADALTLLATHDGILPLKEEDIITPHPGEAARLLEQHVEFILDEPLDALSRLHDLCGCCVLLKGARTLVSDGDATYISLYGTPALAKGGSGDVLSGILTALLCQRNRLSTSLSTSALAAYGVLIHALAGLRAEKRFGANCSTPQALIDAIRLDDKEL